MNAKHWQILPIGLVAAILILSLACQGLALPTGIAPTKPNDAVESEDDAKPTEEVSLSPVSAKIGEVIQSGDLVMFVVGWENIAPTTHWKPEPGKKFIAVEFILVNAGKIPLPLSCYSDIYLKDDTAQMYDNSSDAQLAGGIPFIGLEINPGEKVRGKVGFQVPENVTSLQFIFDSKYWNAGKIFVNLEPEPVSVQAPSELPGVKPQTSHKVGETIQIGSLAITVNGVTYPAGTDFSKPVQGYKFIAVDVTIENNGTVSAEYHGGQRAIMDSLGWFYEDDIHATMAAGGNPLTVNLVPGEKIRGQVVFQVPVSATGLVFGFDDDNYEPGRILVALP